MSTTGWIDQPTRHPLGAALALVALCAALVIALG